jgi:ATP-dependent Clp protease adaptor protein ClpS
MSAPSTTLAPRARTRPERPRLYKVILLNDDFTPREFVVKVLKAVFRMDRDEAYTVMLAAHQRGACVVAVFTFEIAEEKARMATDMGHAGRLSAAFHHGARGRDEPRRETLKFGPVHRISRSFLRGLWT